MTPDMNTDPDRPLNNPLRLRKTDLAKSTDVPGVRDESKEYKKLNNVPDKAKVMSVRHKKRPTWIGKALKTAITIAGVVLTPKSKIINVVGILRQVFLPYDVYALNKQGGLATEISGTPIVDVRATVIAKALSFVLASLGAYLATRFLGEKGIELFERLLTILEKTL